MCGGWKSPFSNTVFWSQTPSGGTPSNINLIYASLKSGLQFCRWQYGYTFIRLAGVASQICEITQNFQKIRTYSSSRSSKVTVPSKVIDLGANGKCMCNFLLVLNSNFGLWTYLVPFLRATAYMLLYSAYMLRQFRPSVRPSVRLSVCPSHAWIVFKRLNISSKFFHCLIGPSF